MIRSKILVADDHTVVLEGLRRILDRPEFEIVGAVRDGHELVEAAARLKPDIIIADFSMPNLNGVEAARQIRKHNPKAKIIFLTMHPEAIYAVQAMRAGGSGYVLKDSAGEELLAAIQEVGAGRTFITASLQDAVLHALRGSHEKREETRDLLTSRQREVLQLLAEGKPPKEIAAVLNVSYRTVEYHKYRIMEALGLRTVAELAAYAVKQGIVG